MRVGESECVGVSVYNHFNWRNKKPFHQMDSGKPCVHRVKISGWRGLNSGLLSLIPSGTIRGLRINLPKRELQVCWKKGRPLAAASPAGPLTSWPPLASDFLNLQMRSFVKKLNQPTNQMSTNRDIVL